MTAVGGEKRPLEDILDRLNDLSRTPRDIDLREPPPVPVRAAGETAAETFVPSALEATAPADAMAPSIAAPVMPATEIVTPASAGPPPVPNVEAPSASPVIDLTVPAAAPLPPTPEPVVDVVDEAVVAPAPPVAPGSAPVSEPVSAVLNRESARLARTPPVDAASRYGRNGAVVPQAPRAALTPANVPLLPVSVKNDLEVIDNADQRSGPNWIRIAILMLLSVALVAALLLVFL